MWTHSIFRYLRRTRARSGPVVRRSPTSRLCVEGLEDRRVPSFGTATIHDTSYGPLSVDVGDFNGDGRADVVGATQLGIAVRLNNGDGTLGNEVLYPVDQYHISTAVGDLNADGVAAHVRPRIIPVGMLGPK